MIENDFCEIKKSPIHGLGVFAKVDIPKNTHLQKYSGIEMTYSDFNKKYNRNYNFTYSMMRINKIIVGKELPYLTMNLSHYINEGLPNVILKKKALYTLVDIKKGQELLLSYPKNYNRDYFLQT